jgi:hypothetical protein
MSRGKFEVMWTPWEGRGLEHLRLRIGESGIEADGVVIGEEDEVAFRARYVIRCDPGWRTREVTVDPLDGGSRYTYAPTGRATGATPPDGASES